MSHFVVGPVIGFAAFFAGVASMKGIFFRPNADGVSKFSMESFIEYIKIPFSRDKEKRNMIWGLYKDIPIIARLKLLNLNWVAMTGLGFFGSVIYHYYFL